MCLFLSVRDATRETLAAWKETIIAVFRLSHGSAFSVKKFALCTPIFSNGPVVFDKLNVALNAISSPFTPFATTSFRLYACSISHTLLGPPGELMSDHFPGGRNVAQGVKGKVNICELTWTYFHKHMT